MSLSIAFRHYTQEIAKKINGATILSQRRPLLIAVPIMDHSLCFSDTEAQIPLVRERIFPVLPWRILSIPLDLAADISS